MAAQGNGDAMAEDKMAELIGRLNLTSEECKVLKVVDDVEEGLARMCNETSKSSAKL